MDLKVVLFIPKGKFIEFIVIYSWVFERLQHLILATFWDISALLPITFTSESLYFTWHPMCPFCGSLGWIKRLLELIQVKVGQQNVLEQVRAPPLSPPYLYWLLILFFVLLDVMGEWNSLLISSAGVLNVELSSGRLVRNTQICMSYAHMISTTYI